MSSSHTETAGQTLVDVTMPQMGVSMAEGTVVAWRFAVGDVIAAEQTVCEISTDKIDTEVPSPVGGVLAEILVEVESTVDVGTVLARIATEGGAAPGGGLTTLEGPSEAGLAAEIPEAAAPPDAAAIASSPPNGNGRAPSRGAGARLSPVVARIAAEHGLDLSGVSGSGRGGRIRKQDVLALLEGGRAASAPAVDPPMHIESPYRPDPTVPVAAPAGSPGAPPAGDGSTLSRMRRQIGVHMKRSLETAATCTTWIEVDFSRVEAARVKLGVTALPIVARAVIESLREFPPLNAWLEGERYTRHASVGLGIAVSLGEDGLIVPVIAEAEQLSVEGISAKIRELARRARSRQLTPDDVQGGTFTITNPGQFGAIMATPVINQPQVAILDLEAVVKRAVVISDGSGNDSIAIRPICILGLSWDHRALDGALAAQFLAALKRRLEGWEAE